MCVCVCFVCDGVYVCIAKVCGIPLVDNERKLVHSRERTAPDTRLDRARTHTYTHSHIHTPHIRMACKSRLTRKQEIKHARGDESLSDVLYDHAVVPVRPARHPPPLLCHVCILATVAVLHYCQPNDTMDIHRHVHNSH